jgi:hypothetical protein
MPLGITQPPFKSYGGFRNLNTPVTRLPFLQEGEDAASNALLSRISQQVSQQEAQQPKNAGSGESYCQNIATEEKDQDLYIVA